MKRKGFTLIELLAVILILGIIALIAIPTVNRLIRDSRRGAWESAGNNIVKSVETHFQALQLLGQISANQELFLAGEVGLRLPGDATLDRSEDFAAGGEAPQILDMMREEINIKGRMPEFEDITLLVVDVHGRAIFEFNADQFICGNSARFMTYYNAQMGTDISGGPSAEVRCFNASNQLNYPTSGTIASSVDVAIANRDIALVP